MFRLKTTLALLALALSLAGCQCGAPAPVEDAGSPELQDPIVVSGVVVDETERSVPGAKVAAGPQQTVTDEGGRFFLTAERGSASAVRVAAEGFASAERRVDLSGKSYFVSTGPITLFRVSARKTIDGKAGGTLTDPARGLVVTIPPGAFSGPVTVEAAVISMSEPFFAERRLPAPLPRLSRGLIAPLLGLVLSAEGLQPSLPLSVSLVTSAKLPGGTRVPVGRFDAHKGDWVDAAVATAGSAGTLDFELDHLSTFAAALPALPSGGAAAPEIADLGQVPSTFLPGEPRVDPRSGALQVGLELPAVIRRNQSMGLTLFFDSRTSLPRPQIGLPTAIPGAGAGDELLVRASSPVGEQLISGTVGIGAGEQAAVTPVMGTGSRCDAEQGDCEWSLPSGTYSAAVEVGRPVAATLVEASNGSFTSPALGNPIADGAGQPVAAPERLPLSSVQARPVAVDNRSQSPFGAGWHLKGLTRLVQPWCDQAQQTLAGDFEVPARTFGPALEQYASRLDEPLLEAGVGSGELAGAQLAIADGWLYVAIDGRSQVWRVPLEGGSAELFAGGRSGDGGVQPTPVCSGRGAELAFETITGLFPDPSGQGVLVGTESCLIRFGADGIGTRIIGVDTGNPSIQPKPPADGVKVEEVDFQKDVQRLSGGLKPNLYVVQTWNDGAYLVQDGVLRPFRMRASSPHGVPVAIDAAGRIAYGSGFSSCLYYWVDGLVDAEVFPTCKEGFPSTMKDGPRQTATVGAVEDIAFDGSGGLWLTNTTFNAVRRLGQDDVLTTVTGGATTPLGGIGGLAREASLGLVFQLAVRGAGDVAVSSDQGLFRLGPPRGRPLRTLGAGDGSLLFGQPDGSWVRTLLDGTQETYDDRGLLRSRGRPGEARLVYQYRAWPAPKDDEPCGRPLPPPLLERLTLAGESLFSFEWAGDHLSAVLDLAGRRSTLGFGAGRVGSITPAGAEPVQLQYDEDGRVTQKTSRGQAGSLATFSYTYREGLLASIEIPGRGVRGFRSEQEASSPPASTVSAAGNVRGAVIGPAKASIDTTTGGKATLAASARGLKITSPSGQPSEIELDLLGRLMKTRRPDGSELRLVRDAQGRIVEMLNVQTGDRWEYQYDRTSEQLSKRVDPAGRMILFLYDDQGRMVSRQDPAGTTRYEYATSGAAEGLPLKQIDPLGRQRMVEYDSGGNPVKLTAPGGLVTLIERDAAGRATKVTEPSGLVHLAELDARGGSTRQVLGDPSEGRVITYTRLVTDGWEEVGSHVPGSALVSATDALGREWTYQRDAAFQITSQRTPGEGQVDEAFDPLGRRVRRQSADGSIERFSYDGSGRMQTRAIDDGPAKGARLTFGYDELDRVKTLEDPERVEERTFAPGLGWTTLDVRAGSGPGGPAQFRLTRARPAPSVLSQSLGAVTYHLHRDFDERVSRVELELGGATPARRDLWVAAFNSARQVTTITRANGVTTQLTYDPAGRVIKQEELGASGTVTFAWTYDSGGRPASRTLNGSALRTFGYEAAGRLGSCSDTAETFTYDRTGARASAAGRAYARDALGRLTSDGLYDYTYDASGKRTSRTSKTSGSDRLEYVWGAGGRLAEVRRGAAGSTTVLARYLWDGTGRRITRSAEGKTWLFGYLPDTDRPARVLDDAAREWHLAHATPAAAWTVAATAAGALRFTHVDPLDRVIGISDESGQLTLLDEDCYGGRTASLPLSGPAVGFHGIAYDEETGLYFAGPRVYEPSTGEFLSPDPKGLLAGADPYGYGGGNPIIAADPSGRLFFVLAGALLAGAVIANGIRSFAQDREVSRARRAYEAITDDDVLDRHHEAEKAHRRLSGAAKKGGETAVKGVKTAVDAVTNPASNAKDLGDQLLDATGEALGEDQEPRE